MVRYYTKILIPLVWIWGVCQGKNFSHCCNLFSHYPTGSCWSLFPPFMTIPEYLSQARSIRKQGWSWSRSFVSYKIRAYLSRIQNSDSRITPVSGYFLPGTSNQQALWNRRGFGNRQTWRLVLQWLEQPRERWFLTTWMVESEFSWHLSFV